MKQASDPADLPTVTMRELYETVYQSRPPVIDGLLCSGTYLFAGAPKVGKSFLVAQLAYHVSTGQKLWGYDVRPGTVLYLALEDDYQRLQERMFRIFGVDGTDKLHFATYAKQLGNGLDEQLDKFVREHPDTRLIIIDTLQKVREMGGEAYSYVDDYQIVGRLKQFADRKRHGCHGQSLGGVQGALFKGRPCWGRQPQLLGAKPPIPLGRAHGTFAEVSPSTMPRTTSIYN